MELALNSLIVDVFGIEAFLPGSQISDKPLKDISHLINEPQKFALIKLDKIRGNACVSRREIISSFKKAVSYTHLTLPTKA